MKMRINRLPLLVYWYIRFSYLWVMSIVMFYAFLLVSSIYQPYIFMFQDQSMYKLLWLRFSTYDYMLLFFTTLFIIAMLFSYEREQGYEYIPSTSRYRTISIFTSKVIVTLILVTIPYVLAKLVAVVFSDPVVTMSNLSSLSSLIVYLGLYQVIYVLWMSGFILLGSIIVGRLGYVIISYTIYFILFEGPLNISNSLLQLFKLYAMLYNMNDLGGVISSNVHLFLASFILYIISYVIYAKREVRI